MQVKPAISHGVDALVKKGIILRAIDATDRRHIRLTLSDSGNTLLDSIFDDTRQWMRQTLTPLSDKELQTLIQAMDFLRKAQPT